MPRPSSSPLRALVPLFAAAFLAYGYNNVFMTLLPSYVQAGIGGSAFQAGLQGSVFLAAAVGLRFFLGPLADRVGTKPVMLLGMGSFVAGAFLLMGCTAFWQVLAVRCVQAVGLAAFYPCATARAANAAPPGRSGFVLGIYRLVTSGSLLLGPVVAFALVAIEGYRACFAAMGVCAAAAFALVVILPPEPHRELHGPNRPGIVSIVRTALTTEPRALAAVLGSTGVAALGYGLLLTFSAGYVSSVDPFANAGAYFTLVGVGGLAINPLAGWLADRMGARRLLVGCLLCTAFGVGLLGVYGTLGSSGVGAVLLVVSGICAGTGYAGTVTCALTVVADTTEPRVRSSVLALQQNAIDLGIACAGVAFGAIATAAGGITGIVFVGQGILMAACVVAGTFVLRRAS